MILAEGVGGSNQCSQKVSLVPNDNPNRWYDHPTHILEIIDRSRYVNKLGTTLENGMIEKVKKKEGGPHPELRFFADFRVSVQKS